MFMRKDQVAIIWEPNDPKEKEIRLTYGELFVKVQEFANGLIKLGVKKGDTVALYLPMVPELAIAMLACARIGAIHSIIFAGFSATALADRVNDAQIKSGLLLLTEVIVELKQSRLKQLPMKQQLYAHTLPI